MEDKKTTKAPAKATKPSTVTAVKSDKVDQTPSAGAEFAKPVKTEAKPVKSESSVKAKQAMIRIKQIGSPIRRGPRQKLYLKSLGLGKLNRERQIVDNLSTRGLLDKLQHMVVVLEQ